MARLFISICAAVMSLFCAEMTDVNPSNNDAHELANFLPVKDIVIETVYDYLLEQEKRLGTLRKHIEDYSKENEQAKQKLSKTLSATNQESANKDDDEVKERADESDDNYVHDYDNYAGTNYERLCSGEILLTEDIQKKLKCRYVDHGIPFLKIAPFKQEEAFLDPRIVLYHDVIYEEEIETLKSDSKPWLKIAATANVTTGEHIIDKDRIAKTATIFEESRHAKLLRRRVEHMTGLSMDTAEPLQATYYSIGGLYLPHYDYFGVDSQFFVSKNGDRIATVLFYMNDVAKGGATVFPKLNVALWPKKGSAAFWYNLKRNGKEDVSTLHGACPLLSGTKWLVTQWLREKGQEFRRPCTLLENE